jgi:hypothetical protein
VFAGRFVHPWRHAGPRGQLRRGREAGHVRAGLGDDHLRDLLSYARNGLQQFQLVRPRGERGGEHSIEFGEGVLDQLQAVQHGAGQLGVARVEMPGQRLGQGRDLGAHLAAGQFGQHRRITLAGDQRVQHRPRRDRGQARGDHRQLDRRVLQHQLQPGGLPGAIAHQLHPVAGQHPQPSDVGRRHEARPDQPALQQLGDPLRVPHIRFRRGIALMCAALASQTSITSSRQ